MFCRRGREAWPGSAPSCTGCCWLDGGRAGFVCEGPTFPALLRVPVAAWRHFGTGGLCSLKPRLERVLPALAVSGLAGRLPTCVEPVSISWQMAAVRRPPFGLTLVPRLLRNGPRRYRPARMTHRRAEQRDWIGCRALFAAAAASAGGTADLHRLFGAYRPLTVRAPAPRRTDAPDDAIQAVERPRRGLGGGLPTPAGAEPVPSARLRLAPADRRPATAADDPLARRLGVLDRSACVDLAAPGTGSPAALSWPRVGGTGQETQVVLETRAPGCASCGDADRCTARTQALPAVDDRALACASSEDFGQSDHPALPPAFAKGREAPGWLNRPASTTYWPRVGRRPGGGRTGARRFAPSRADGRLDRGVPGPAGRAPASSRLKRLPGGVQPDDTRRPPSGTRCSSCHLLRAPAGRTTPPVVGWTKTRRP